MSLDAWFKRQVYWADDALHGGTIRKMYNTTAKVLDSWQEGYPIQQRMLADVLAWATTNSELYKPYAGKELQEFPVMNKLTLVEHHDQNTVDPALMDWQVGDVFIQKTSGSTGVPFAVPQDTHKRQRRVADLKYFNETVGFKSHEKLGQCRIWTKWHSKSKSQVFWENIIPINIGKLDDDRMADLVRTVKDEKLFALRAYASWYDYLVDYIKRGKCDVADLKSLHVCLSISEGLNPATKEAMLELTGVPIVETYANEETGTIAHQRLEGTDFYVNHAGYVVEPLKLDSDEPAEFGEIARIVVTDLYNYAFPMIRYDTGDTAVFAPGNDASHGWPYIQKLYGRRMDMVFDTQGGAIHPMNFGRTLKNYGTIRQWQFVQEDQNAYVLKVEVTDDSELDDMRQSLLDIVGADANLRIQKVDDIPVLRSGKRKPVVCEWKH